MSTRVFVCIASAMIMHFCLQNHFTDSAHSILILGNTSTFSNRCTIFIVIVTVILVLLITSCWTVSKAFIHTTIPLSVPRSFWYITTFYIPKKNNFDKINWAVCHLWAVCVATKTKATMEEQYLLMSNTLKLSYALPNDRKNTKKNDRKLSNTTKKNHNRKLNWKKKELNRRKYLLYIFLWDVTLDNHVDMLFLTKQPFFHLNLMLQDYAHRLYVRLSTHLT